VQTAVTPEHVQVAIDPALTDDFAMMLMMRNRRKGRLLKSQTNSPDMPRPASGRKSGASIGTALGS
jgi:hypothetical protein